MYILENAFLNIMKNKGRNILLGVIIFAVIATTVIGMAIYNTSASIIEDYKTRFGSEVSIAPKTQQVGGNSGNTQTDIITPEQTLSFAQSEYLQSADLSSSLSCFSSELSAIGQSDKSNPTTSSGTYTYGGDLKNATMRLRGDYFTDFSEKTRQLANGEMPKVDGECIVSTDFAELNGLTIGDTISVTAELFGTDNEIQTIEIPLSVVGMYYDVTDEYGAMGGQFAYRNRRNEILTTFDTVLNAQIDGLSGVAINAVYYLQSPEMLSAFETEIRAKGLPDSYKVSTDEASYLRMTAPVEGLQSVSLTFLIIVLVFGAAIMILLSVIAIRERKYEIGVLRAMGMKKKKVALGLWAEIIVVTCICFVIGMSVGVILSQPVSDTLLAGQVQSVPSASDIAVNVSVDGITALEIFGISILLASIAGAVSVSRITKYEPIKILMERN